MVTGLESETPLLSEADISGPNISAFLVKDSGKKQDGITNKAGVTGNVTDDSSITGFKAGFGEIADFDILATLENDGSFLLSRSRLEKINNGALEDGEYVLKIVAEDELGNSSEETVAFTLETTKPEIEIIEPVENQQLTPGSKLRGVVDDDNGVINNLKYKFPGEKKVSISPGGIGEFETEINLEGIEPGTQKLKVSGKDIAGNKGVGKVTVEVLGDEEDTSPPVINAGLVADTGVDDEDGITNNVEIAGTVIDASEIIAFKAGFGAGPTVDVLVELLEDGSFTFDLAKLEEINGGNLADGAQVFQLEAEDELGNISEVFALGFTKDTVAPVASIGNNLNSESTSINILYNEAVANEALVIENYTVQIVGGDEIEIASIEQVNESEVKLNFANSFNAGEYELIIEPGIGDLAGNLTEEQVITFNIEPPVEEDTEPPVINAGLVDDTGVSNSDGITNNVEIAGTVIDASAITALKAGFGAGPTVDVLVELLEDGSFTFDLAKLEEINGGNLADGAQVFQLEATDEFGNISEVFALGFVKDTVAPELEITNPVAGATITTGSKLKGTATDNNLGEVSYRFDELGKIVVTTNNVGVFDQEFDFTGVGNGQRVVTVLTEDLAGNVTDESLGVIVSIGGGGGNQPPIFDPVEDLTVTPGGRVEVQLNAIDPEGKQITYSLQSNGDLPQGMLEGDGKLVFNPTPEQLGEYELTLVASDGEKTTTQTVNLSVVADPITITRISGIIQNTDGEGLPGLTVNVGNVEVETGADGSFLLEFPNGVPDDFLRIGAGQQSNGLFYPNISENISLMLGHEIYDSYNNVIERPIYLPPIDVENAVEINPNEDVAVTTPNIPGAEVFVAAGSLESMEGEPYTGLLSITEVPPELTPAALPENLLPDLLVTIQPGEMVFTTPAPLDLPNTGGYAPGTLLDLWSINPETGDFDKVGVGEVSSDGSVIQTTSGGIINSSWHFFSPPPPTPEDPTKDNRNKDDGCECCNAEVPVNSVVQLHSGAVVENHDLVTYQSQGVDRGITLTYDSIRANPQPILHFGYQDVQDDPDLRLVAELIFNRGDFEYQVPGAAAGFGLNGGEHFWNIPAGGGKIDAALQANFRALASGRYNYELSTGLLRLNAENILTGTRATNTGQIINVNSIGSAFGNGWGLTGLQELIENPDGSVLLIDGNGSELLFELENNAYVSPAGDFSVLEKLNNGTFRRTMTDETVYTFNNRNQIDLMRDRNGNEMDYVYNPNGQLIKIIDPVGLETSFNYTGNVVTQIVDPAGRVTKLEYDGAGNLIKITDPDNTSRTWEYDAEYLMSGETDKRGNQEETIYDFAGRADQAVRKDGSVIKVDPAQVQGLYQPSETLDPLNAPDAFQLSDEAQASYTDANGKVTNYILDQAGQIVSAFDEEGALPTVERNEDNLITQQTDARGNATVFTYDEDGNVLTVVDSLSFGGQFIDISNTGQPVSAINNTDDNATLVDLPFSFTFYGETYQQIGISSNGLLSFGGTNSEWTNEPLNSGSGLNGLPSILPFWDDLETRSNEGYVAKVFTETLGQPGNQQFIIQWHQLEHYPFGSETGDITLQVILSEGTNGIQFNYLDVDFEGNTDNEAGEGRSATVGIWNSNNEFQQYSFNEGKLTNGLSLFVTETGITEGNGSGQGTGSRNFTYDPVFDQVTSITDELGHKTLFDIDPNNGNIRSITQVIGAEGGNDDLVTKFTYTGLGLVDLITDPLGRVTNYDYDAFERLTKITFAQGTADQASQLFEYDSAGNQTAIIDENGNRTKFEYDALNRLIRIIEADPDAGGTLTSPITNFTYDAAGNLVTTTDALGNVTQNNYDVLDRLIKNIDSLNQRTDYTYDAVGNLLSIVDPLGNLTKNIYDARNRLIQTIDPDGGVTKFAYDLDDNVVSVIDPENNQTIFNYDARDRLTKETDPLGATITYQYDAVDNLIGLTDRNSRVTQFTYDDIDRLLKENWVGDEQEFNYTYDKASNLVSVTDEFSALTYTYDNRDRVLTVNNNGTPKAPQVLLAYQYDDVGNVIGLTDTINGTAGGNNGYTYDDLNRLIELTQSGNNVSNKRVDFAYNALGQFTAMERYANLAGTDLVVSTTHAYDELNRLINITHNNGAADVAFYDFEYDAASRITKITDVDGITDYTYDQRSQLIGANHSNGNNPDETYTYDANGNRVNSSIHGNGYVTGPGNRLLSDGVYNYDYDAEGNLISQTEIATGEAREYVWDYRNRLTAIVDKDAGGNETQRVEFTYDAFDRRISKTVDGVVTHFVYDGEDVLLEFVDEDGNNGANEPVLTQRYLHGPLVDQVLAQEDGEGNVVWLLTDHLGTTKDLVNNNGAVVNHLVYDSFGRVISETAPDVDTRYLFTGREFDEETGLYYYRARYYDAEVGRFISEDPIGFAGGDANIYAALNNAPTIFVDPSGLEIEGTWIKYPTPSNIEVNFQELSFSRTGEVKILPPKVIVFDAKFTASGTIDFIVQCTETEDTECGTQTNTWTVSPSNSTPPIPVTIPISLDPVSAGLAAIPVAGQILAVIYFQAKLGYYAKQAYDIANNQLLQIAAKYATDPTTYCIASKG